MPEPQILEPEVQSVKPSIRSPESSENKQVSPLPMTFQAPVESITVADLGTGAQEVNFSGATNNQSSSLSLGIPSS